MQNDLITWLLDAAPENLRTPRHIIHRVLILHLASIHTSSNVSVATLRFQGELTHSRAQTLTHTLFHLASTPEHLATLREEIAEVTSRKGWTKEAIDEMYKLDSYMRESQRLNGLASGMFFDIRS